MMAVERSVSLVQLLRSHHERRTSLAGFSAKQGCKHSGWAAVLAASLASLGCSAPAADGDPDFDGAPPFSAAGAGSNAQSPAAPNAPTNTGGSMGGASAGEGNPSGVNAPGSSGGASNSGSVTPTGAGGAAMVTPSGGAGGGNSIGGNGTGVGGGGSPSVDGNPPVDFGEGLFFADDFEAGINMAWRNTSSGGSIVHDVTRGANGTSASIRVDGNGQFHTMLQFALPASVRASNRFYGRVQMRVDQTPGQGHFVWVEAGSAVGDFLQGNDQNELRIGSNLGLLQVNHYGGPPGGDQDIRDRNRRLTPGVWHCLQFFMNGNPEELQVLLDGEETALSTTNFTAQRDGSEGNGTPLDDWMPPFDAIRFGWELSGSTIWYDEVALGEERLPACE